MKRKVGDKVKIKSTLTIGKIYGGITYSLTMNSFKGLVTVISEVKDNHYILQGFENWGFSDDMLEDVSILKWKFNILEFKNNNIAIHCKTLKEADKLFDILFSNGIQTWSDGDNINRSKIYYNDYKEYTCYEFDKSYREGIAFGEMGYYEEEKYKIYKFSEIDFSKIWNKENIDEVTLNNFDITKIKYITKEQLALRGYKTGDILFDGESMAIVYGNKVLHINTNWIETLNPKAFDRILPIELIESDSEIQRLLSGKLSRKISQAYLEDLFVKIKEKDTTTTKLYQVEFTYNSASLKNFISNDSEIEIGDIVECQCSLNSPNYQYCKVKNIIEEELTIDEIKLYRNCRKISL